MRRIFEYPAATEADLPPGGDLAAATPNQRIATVWPLICAKATTFVGTLKGRERANWDAEDVANSIWVTLRTKDAKWAPDRGKYVTFAAVVIHNELCSIRDQAGTVEGPRNVTDRLKEYQAEEDEGTLTAKRAETFESIRRVVGEWKPVGDAARMTTERPDDAAESAELGARFRAAIVEAMKELTPLEARVAGLSYGLWGQERQTADQIAAIVDRRVGIVRQAKKSAGDKIRERLRESGHPHVASDN